MYSTAKSEYTEQFCLFLVPALQAYFLELIDDAKEREKDQRKVLWVFQNLLKDIPEWNQDKVNRETEKIIQSSRCDYLEELLTAVFIAHTKVLSAIRLTNKEKKKIQITVPKLEHFLHRSLSESARTLWSNAYLFSEQGTGIERQKNLRQVESLLYQAVLQSIRGMLPVKNILREYLNNDGYGNDTEDADEKEVETKKDEKEVETKPKEEEQVAIDLSGATVAVPVVVPVDVTVSNELLTTTPPNTPEAPEEKQVETKQDDTRPQEQQVLVFETEQSVKFAEHDTVFDTENQLSHRVRSKSADFDNGGNDDDDDEEQISILDEAPQAMDEFEELEDTKSSGIDNFERLD